MSDKFEHGLNKSYLIVIAVILVSLVIGVFSALISQVIYLFLIFPIMMGLICGVLISKINGYKKRIDNSRLILLGVLAGIIVTISFHLVRYQLFRFGLGRLVEADLIAVYGDSAYLLVSQVVDQIIFSVSGSRGFWGYLVLLANQGFSFRTISYMHLISGATEPQNTGSIVVWIYWIFSFFIVSFFSVYVSLTENRKPKTKEKFLGEVNIEDIEKIMTIIQQGELSSIKHFFVEDAGIPCLMIYLHTIENNTQDGTLLVIKRIFTDENGKYLKQAIFEVKITSEQAGVLQ